MKTMVHNLPDYQKHLAEESEVLERVEAGMMTKHRPMVEASAAAVKPVRHVIRIEAGAAAESARPTRRR